MVKRKTLKYFTQMAIDAVDVINTELKHIGGNPIEGFQQYEMMRVMRSQIENAYDQGFEDSRWISDNGDR